MDDQFQKCRTADVSRGPNKPPLKTIAYYANETFTTSPQYPGLQIGSHGTIYDERQGMKLNQYCNAPHFYPRVDVWIQGKARKEMEEVHRIMMTAFSPLPPNSGPMDVNHINGCKWDNRFYGVGDPRTNIEWCTHKENIQHAIRTGLTPVGEDSANAVYSQENAIKLCALMARGMGAKEALLTIGMPYNPQTKAFAEHLKYGDSWKHITQNYEFQTKHNDHHTEPEIHLICQYIEKGLSDDEVSQVMATHGYHDKPRFIQSIRKHDKPWAHISRQYNFQYRQKPFKPTDEEKHQFCEYVEMGYTYTQIQQLMGFNDTPAKTLASLISGLKKGSVKSWLPISSQYNLNRKVDSFYPSQQVAAGIMHMAKEGFTIAQIAKAFEVDIKALNTWLYSGARRRADYVVPRVV